MGTLLAVAGESDEDGRAYGDECDDNLLTLETGERRYVKLAASRLKSVRVLAGMSEEEVAARLSDVFGHVVTARQIEIWERGEEEFGVSVMLAAMDVTGVTVEQLMGIDAPSIEAINRLEGAIARVRSLLNDPAALTERAHAILTGTARGTHPKPLI